MKIYSKLSKIGFLKDRYTAKFVFVAVLSIFIPVILFCFVLFFVGSYLTPLFLFFIAMALLILGIVSIVLVIKSLMLPVIKASEALQAYDKKYIATPLPDNYTDEAGLLLKNIAALMRINQKLVTDKKDLCTLLINYLKVQTLESTVLVNSIYEKSTSHEIGTLASDATASLKGQINFIDTFVELLVQEELINKQPIKIRTINLQELFEEVKQKRKIALEVKNIKINFKIAVSKTRLKGSKTLFLQAFGYLIDHAIKCAPENSEIDILTEKNRGKLLIQVKDAGIGYENLLSEQFFSKLNLFKENQASYASSTGIYLTGQIIERFGGSISAESKGINRGTLFLIELKLYR
jgi:signal transduction histidine kinase